MSDMESLWWTIVGLIAGAVLVAAAFDSCSEERKCEDAGGRVEKYDCVDGRTSHGTPITTCKRRCVGAPPEASP